MKRARVTVVPVHGRHRWRYRSSTKPRRPQRESNVPPKPRRNPDQPLTRTTVRLRPNLLKAAQIRAIHEDLSLQDLVAAALERELQRLDRRDQRRRPHPGQ